MILWQKGESLDMNFSYNSQCKKTGLSLLKSHKKQGLFWSIKHVHNNCTNLDKGRKKKRPN